MAAQSKLAVYLNDHVAGSVGVLELLSHVEAVYPESDTSRFAGELRSEVLADRRELEALMAKLSIHQSATRKASAWVAEKLSQWKLWADDRAAGALHLLEAMEAVSIGVEGKRLLWRALDHAAAENPDLRGPDYARLSQRAEDQRSRIEQFRLRGAKEALAASQRPAGV